jgi:hypothetical protein
MSVSAEKRPTFSTQIRATRIYGLVVTAPFGLTAGGALRNSGRFPPGFHAWLCRAPTQARVDRALTRRKPRQALSPLPEPAAIAESGMTVWPGSVIAAERLMEMEVAGLTRGDYGEKCRERLSRPVVRANAAMPWRRRRRGSLVSPARPPMSRETIFWPELRKPSAASDERA